MRRRIWITATALILLPLVGMGQIPTKPSDDGLPTGYEWYIQQNEEQQLVWVPKLADDILVQSPPTRPTDPLPKGWDWYPKYDAHILVTWKAEIAPNWFQRNRELMEFLGGFIMAFMGYGVGSRRKKPT